MKNDRIHRLILFNKPYQVMCRFTDETGRKTLADYLKIPEVYPAGRLDYDSEGLLVLTDSGYLQSRIAHPNHQVPKTYLAQVEGLPSQTAIAQLACGVVLRDCSTLPAKAELIEPPDLWPRVPPIRERKTIPTSWLKLTITEGRNRQVRRMTAAVGHPTLRLVRQSIGEWTLGALQPGQWDELTLPQSPREIDRIFDFAHHNQ